MKHNILEMLKFLFSMIHLINSNGWRILNVGNQIYEKQLRMKFERQIRREKAKRAILRALLKKKVLHPQMEEKVQHRLSQSLREAI